MTDPKRPARGIFLDSLLALACGLLFWWMADKRLANHYMLAPYDTADMVDYCLAILHLGGDEGVGWSLKRSKLTGLVATVFAAEDGIMDGLRSSSAIATVLMGAGLYAWGRRIAGRGAGLATVATSFALSPLMLMPRMLTFYPLVSAMLVWSAVAVTHGLMSRNPKMLAVAGAGIGLVLLADVRGLVWAVPFAAGTLAALWMSRDRRQAALWLMVPLLLSFGMGRWSFPEGAVSFEKQFDTRPLFMIYGSDDPAHQPPHDTGGDFVWGRSAPWTLPITGFFVLNQLTLDPPKGFPPDVSRFKADDHLTPLVPVWWGAGLLVLGLLWRKPRALLAVGATVFPFAIAFHGQQNMAEIYIRFLCQILPGLSLLVGVAVGSAIDRIPGPWRGLPGESHPLRAVVAGGLTALITLGHIGSPASPWASWRRPWPLVGELLVVHPESTREVTTERFQTCKDQLVEDRAQGKWMPAHPRWRKGR